MVARDFLLSHMALVVGDDGDQDSAAPKKLEEGQMKLYSFYKPGLLAETYTIEVEQNIVADKDPPRQTLNVTNARLKNQQLPVTSPQVFTVVVPRFNLERSIVNSYYPPDGHTDEGRILPHIVFNDPHFPWEIPAGSFKSEHKGVIDPPTVHGQPPTGRGMVPWIALLVFDVDELRFEKTDLEEMRSFKLEGFSTEADLARQNSSGTFGMNVAQYYQNIPATARNHYDREAGLPDSMLKSREKINVIFPSKAIVRKAIGQYISNGVDLDLQSHKYLAHVRHINTENCPDSVMRQEGIFSIVMSPRTGSIFDNAQRRTPMTQPKTQVCHLVTIEHLDATIAEWQAPYAGRVGLISLFSWIYTALPPNPVNFVTTVRHLTENQQMLRVEDSKLNVLDETVKSQGNDGSPKTQVGKIMAARLRAGYTVSRWRTQTGEETAAFTRGPLVPLSQPSNRPAALDIVDSSNTSQAYQILDPQTGMMDLTYSSAWQVGKILAISDTNFSAALMRFRSRVYETIASRTRMKTNGVRHTRKLVTSMAAAVSALEKSADVAQIQPSRFRPSDVSQFVTLLKDADANPLLQSNTASVVKFNAMAGDQIFNDFNAAGPNNSDWTIIHSWLHDKLLLGGIPSQYLLPESSYLPKESLRFFYIDDFWLDCLIDGALSIANHLDGDDDLVRREMKKIFNTYLSTPINKKKSPLTPQIPCYGFVIRSQLIKTMPDMKIEIEWTPDPNWGGIDPRAPFCRWSKWDEQTLLCLLDRPPEELKSIVLKQPTHQQRFSLGNSIDISPDGKVNIHFEVRQLFTIQNPPSIWPDLGELPVNHLYDVDSRTIKLNLMAQELNAKLRSPPSGATYTDTTSNSCEFGLELNDPVYFFSIVPPEPKVTPAFNPRNRQLWIKEPKPQPPKEPVTGPTPRQTPQPPISTPPLIPPTTQPIFIPTAPDRQPKIQPLPPSLAQTNAHPTTTSIQSRFDLRIFADYKGPPKRYLQDKYDANDYIPTQNIYFFDLIFSIRKKPNHAGSQYDLLKIIIDIPVASDPNSRTEALLTPNYDGPGLRMLSNQRFIPFLYHDIPSAPLHVELIPRSADDDYTLKINDRKTRELGFRLAEANISPVRVSSDVEIEGERFRQPRGKVVVTMTEFYKVNTPDGIEAVSTQYRLIKWDKQDDEELDDSLLP